MPSESVKVAVRVRPFNQREKERNAKLIIEMNGNTTKITNPNNPDKVKTFNFDYSYWSHDGFETSTDDILIPENPSSRYVSQQKLFMDLGQGVLDNAVQGYNCSLFAYGQTGSGKSYSIIGFDNNKGIVPITCNELFKIIESKSNEHTKYAVSLSMLEIYNERVKDLLALTSTSKGNLPIREHKDHGFYVQDLLKVPVGNYSQIEKRMNKGTSNRTIAATQMNATSSRAHTVITIEFNQIIKSEHGSSAKSSVIQLIDLAGSERADSTGATGDRLMEGANINKSLSALGNVISALAESNTGNKTVIIPYRDSVLTKLLKNALGGNSKTIMIAALSPADINYEETLSTLRYANRVKKVKNIAIINENPMEKLIRELTEENERLKLALSGQLPKDINCKEMSDEEIKIIRREIEDELKREINTKSQILELQDSVIWKNKVKEAESQIDDELEMNASNKVKFPFLTNLNEDPQLTESLCYFIINEKTIIGKLTDNASKKTCITIFGPKIQKEHGLIFYNILEKVVSIQPFSSDCLIRVNGQKIPHDKYTDLCDLDRVVLGSNNVYLFKNPLRSSYFSKVWTWELAQCEIAEAEGFYVEDISYLESQIIEILPMVHEVNAISEEMKKQRKFDVLIIPVQAQDVPFRYEAKPKVMIKMTNVDNCNKWLWERSYFINRRYIIQEIYEKFLEGEDISDMPAEKDPFWEPPTSAFVGLAHIFLQNLMYNIGISHSVNVIDYKGRQEGILSVKIEPSDKDGIVLDPDECFVEDCKELLNRPCHLKVSIDHLTLFKAKFIHGSNVRFSVYQNEREFQTQTVRNTLEPDFHFIQVISWPTITEDHLAYFQDGVITFRIYGIQNDIQQPVTNIKTNFKQNKLILSSGLDFNKIKTENYIMQAINNYQTKKLKNLKELCREWGAKPSGEQLFEPFFKSVSDLTFDSSKKFKLFATVIGKTALMGKDAKTKNL